MLAQISEMKSVPVLGLYNSEVISLSKKLAESYNRSIKKVNTKKFLGFDFEIIPEISGCLSTYNFEDRILEIHLNKYTSFVIPSGYSEPEHFGKYFDIQEENLLEKNVLLENIDRTRKIYETITLKGLGGKIKDASKHSKKIAKKIFKKDSVKIENYENMQELAASVTKSLNNVLGGSVDDTAFISFIEDFFNNPDNTSVQKIYDEMFDKKISSKFHSTYVSEFNKFFEKVTKRGEVVGSSSESKILKIVALSYEIKSMQARALSGRSNVGKFLNTASSMLVKIHNTLVAVLRGMSSALWGSLSGLVAYKGVFTGLGKGLTILISSALKMLGYLVEKAPTEKSAQAVDATKGKTASNAAEDEKWWDKLVDAGEDIIDKGREVGEDAIDAIKYAGKEIADAEEGEKINTIIKLAEELGINIKKGYEYTLDQAKEIGTEGWEALENITRTTFAYVLKTGGEAADKIGEILQELVAVPLDKMDETLFGNCLKYLVLFVTLNFFYSSFRKFIPAIRKIFKGEKYNNAMLKTNFDPQKSLSNWGFDKMISSALVHDILLAHLKDATKNDKFNKEEKKRLVSLFNQLLKSSKKEVKEGHKYFVKKAGLK